MEAKRVQPGCIARAIVSRNGRIVYDEMPSRAQREGDYETYRNTFKKEPEGVIVAGELIDFPAG